VFCQLDHSLQLFFTDALAYEKLVGDLKESAAGQESKEALGHVERVLLELDGVETKISAFEGSLERQLEAEISNTTAAIQSKLERLGQYLH
jgi:hypothetical protein